MVATRCHPVFPFAVATGVGTIGICLIAILAWTIFSNKLTKVERQEAIRASALAKISAENRNHLDEARFFRHQLKAQRLQGPETWRDFRTRPITWFFAKPAEKGLGWAYEIFADYGLSFMRPLLALIAMTLASAWLIWAWEGGGLNSDDPARQARFWEERSTLIKVVLSDPDLLEAVSYSTSRAFPFGPWGEIETTAEGAKPDKAPRCAVPFFFNMCLAIRASWERKPVDETPQCAFAARFLAVGACRPNGLDLTDPLDLEAHRLATRLMGLGQSLVTIILAFLFGLAVRRRFQIS